MTTRLRLLCAAVLGSVVAAVAGPAAADPGPVGGTALTAPGVLVGSGARSAPPDGAAAWLIADAASGKVLAAKQARVARPPASVLKSLTAVALMPRLDPAQEVVATYDDAVQEGSKVGLVPDATYTVADLWRGLMLPSGNDAAHALGAAVGGQAEAVALMTAEAQRLQANDTVVVNTSGLDAPGQVSTAYDLALIARAGLQRADFRELVGTISADFPGKPAAAGQPRPTYKIYNQNRLLRAGYDGAIGVKTGFTTKAGRTFVGAAERDGRTLIVVLLGTSGRSEPAAADLLNWGFANTAVQPVGLLVDPLTPTVTIDAAPAAAETGVTLASSSRSLLTAALIAGLIAATIAGVTALLAWDVRRRQPRYRPRARGGSTASLIRVWRP